jgi:hypothetical protein
MHDKSEWTSADFDTLSWHDCSVYGFRLEQRPEHEGHGTADLALDIDFIVEWLCHDDRTFQFRVAPATLTFHDVFGLRIELDYASVSAGMTPFTVAAIEREEFSHVTGHRSFRWRLPINWPSGVIAFEASGFTQVLRRAPILVDRQALLPHERRAEA